VRTKPTMRKRMLRSVLVAAFSTVVALGAVSGLTGAKGDTRADSAWPVPGVDVRADSAWPIVVVSGPSADSGVGPAGARTTAVS
jgi:hypothetical protein